MRMACALDGACTEELPTEAESTIAWEARFGVVASPGPGVLQELHLGNFQRQAWPGSEPLPMAQ